MSYLVQNPSQLSDHIKALRKHRKMTQAQLAARLGVGQSRMAAIEKNPALISVEQLMAILSVLQTRLELRPQEADETRPTSAGVDW
ncbi:hypothetical protein THUN1379_06670 [Paludibacterium sp. THUN1379]|uniref:helix-turn-helix transcriptional regulator n=1 Tax=Paludibacterium sp. THUN1379 TaxID=3112107 RepID=UPI003084FEF3|nr:hypothetical protein THUN1379_06670 [Paludibacterium sp. THUN1379]